MPVSSRGVGSETTVLWFLPSAKQEEGGSSLDDLLSSAHRLTQVRKVTVCTGAPSHRAFPAVEKLNNGDLLVAFREGTDHWRTKDGVVRLTRSEDGGTTWSESSIVFEDPEWNCGSHHGMAQIGNGRILLPVTKLRPSRDSHVQEIWLLISDDNGYTWTGHRKLGPMSGWMWQNQYGKVLQLDDGTVIVPGGGAKAGENYWRTGFFVLDEEGENCTGHVTVASGLADEISIIKLSDGRLLAMIRDLKTRFLYRSYSEDNGRTWSPYTNSSIYGQCPCLFITERGVTLCAHRDVRDGHAGLGTSCSFDEGATWNFAGQLYTGANNDCSYPSMVYLDSGEIFCVYYTAFVEGNCDIEGVFLREDSL